MGGAQMEAIITRLNYKFSQKKRLLLLSDTLAAPLDFADWANIEKIYNYSASNRPVEIRCSIQSFPGRHYLPRMNVMNKGIYASIKSYAKEIGKNVTIFVSSRAQSRSTALELISHLASDDVTGDTISFLNCRESNLEFSLQNISDKVAKHALSFGIGLHHNALSSNDKDIILNMY